MSVLVDDPIGYYVHHHGVGHAAHASALASALDAPLVGLGSGPPPEHWPGDWVHLERDDEGTISGDPTRAGAWHWLPTGHRGLSDRMRRVASWITTARPAAVISDVSCEVTCLAALLGVPTGHVLLHGDRSDRPHRLAFDTADLLLAPWPAVHAEPAHRRWHDKVRHLGLLSRFDGRPSPAGCGDGSVLVLLPGGEHSFRALDIAAAAAATGRRWTVAGELDPPPSDTGQVEWLGPVADPWPLLVRSSIVVATAGAGSIGDIAAARRPAVLLPQTRPFLEQRITAEFLAPSAPVRVLSAWPHTAWPAIIDEAAALDGSRWSTLHDGRGSLRFAASALELARSAQARV